MSTLLASLFIVMALLGVIANYINHLGGLTSSTIIISLANATRTTTEIIQPANVWPLILICVLLIATVDQLYFPTGGIATVYVILMFYYGYFPLDISWSTSIAMIIGTIIYFILGALWFAVKFWSFLRDPKNTATIERIEEGAETKFFLNNLRTLYPHFLYWPFSVPHTVLTKLFYQLFESIARRYSGYFGRMVATRREELKPKTPRPVQKESIVN